MLSRYEEHLAPTARIGGGKWVPGALHASREDRKRAYANVHTQRMDQAPRRILQPLWISDRFPGDHGREYRAARFAPTWKLPGITWSRVCAAGHPPSRLGDPVCHAWNHPWLSHRLPPRAVRPGPRCHWVEHQQAGSSHTASRTTAPGA